MMRWRLGMRIPCAECGGSAVCVRISKREGTGMGRAFRCERCEEEFYPLPAPPCLPARRPRRANLPPRRAARTATRS